MRTEYLATNCLKQKRQRELILTHSTKTTNIAQYKQYLLREVSRYPAIKENKRKYVVAHALGDFDLWKLGSPLSQKDKAALHLSYNKPVTSEMIALVEPAFIPYFDIDEALSLIVSNARNKHLLHCKWVQLVTNKCTLAVELQIPRDEMCCKWCVTYSHRALKKSFNLPKQLQYNCNCLWFRGAVVAH